MLVKGVEKVSEVLFTTEQEQESFPLSSPVELKEFVSFCEAVQDRAVDHNIYIYYQVL